MGMKQKNQNGRLKKLRFSKPQILNIFLQKVEPHHGPLHQFILFTEEPITKKTQKIIIQISFLQKPINKNICIFVINFEPIKI
jgi:hypothetical protein